MNNIGSSAAIVVGVLSLAAGIGNVERSPNDVARMVNLGIYLILGGLAFRSSKYRRTHEKAARLVRIVLEILATSVIAFLVFGVGKEQFYRELFEDPIIPMVGMLSILFWAISCILPMRVDLIGKTNGLSIVSNMKEAEPSVVSNAQKATSQPTSDTPSKLLVRAGVYIVEGIRFRIYSSGRVLVLQSDIKPLDGAGDDFRSIGWFLRAYPDIDLNSILRLND